MAARSWNSSTENPSLPWRVESSPFSSITCNANAVDDSASAAPANSDGCHRVPKNTNAMKLSSHRRQGNLRRTETEDGLPHRPQSFRPEFEPDQEEQQNDAELREMQNLLGIALGEQGSDAKGSKQNAGHQVAENRGYSEPARQWRRQRQSRQKNGQFVESHSVPRLVMGLTRTVILH